ncbi:hypothetical protein T492DRAFT_845422 [Pavlovales sp. CCMP2436]|nr:hypothetical protein T492DRAFT_845422 [Pavlovales sp. CCMP2436]
MRRLLGTRVLTLEGAGHAPLLETDVDLLKILEEAAVLTQPRPKPRDYVGRQELANPELQAAVSQKTMLPIRRLVSPKFFSTTESGAEKKKEKKKRGAGAGVEKKKRAEAECIIPAEG